MDKANNSANMKLEPGMMCLVFGLVIDTKFNGLCVTLKSHSNESKGVEWGNWVPGDWICLHRSFGEDVDGMEMFNEKNLMPIRPEEDPLEMSMQSIEDYLDSKQKEKA